MDDASHHLCDGLFASKIIMEDKKTISHLQSMLWYRALKVFYISALAVVLISCNFLIWSSVYIENDYSYFSTLPPPPTGQIGMTLDQVKNQTKTLTSGGGIFSQIANQQSVNNSWDAFDKAIAKSQQASQPSILSVLVYFILGNIAVLLFFEFIRRAFYYIVLGSVRPRK